MRAPLPKIPGALALALALLASAVAPAQAQAENRVERRLLVPGQFTGSAVFSPSEASAYALRVQDLRERAQRGPIPVLVGFKVPFAPLGLLSPAEQQQQAQDIVVGRQALAASLPSLGSSVLARAKTYSEVPFMALTVSAAELEALLASPEVLSVVEDPIASPTLTQSVDLIKAKPTQTAGLTGLGQAVAVLDSGTDLDHPFIGPKVVDGACFNSNGVSGDFAVQSQCAGGARSALGVEAGRNCPIDVNGCDHGTHVAGIAAGGDTVIGGVAPQARIVSMQVFSKLVPQPPLSGPARISAFFSDLVAALNRVATVRQQHNIVAVNMSLGGGANGLSPLQCDAEVPALTAVVANLKSLNVAVVSSAGNDGSRASLSLPGCLTDVVSVGSTTSPDTVDTGPDVLSSFSNFASHLDLLAPGSTIVSSVPAVPQPMPFGAFANKNGTSMAAPHVAGAWALLRQANPTASVDAVLDALKTTGKPIQDARDGGSRLFKPRIDVALAADVLAPTITVARAGTANGTVSSSPAGIQCGQDCEMRLVPGTRFTLSATPDAGAQFDGWSGDCSGRAACTLTMGNLPLITTATFSSIAQRILTVTRRGTGGGEVRSDVRGIVCGDACSASYENGTTVVLGATPNAESNFTGWGGACSGTGVCAVTMSGARSVTASFTPKRSFALTVSRVGTNPDRGLVIGGVAGACAPQPRSVPSTAEGADAPATPAALDTCTEPAQIDCGPDCSETLVEGSTVTLNAVALVGATFAGWEGGACVGTQACVVTMSQAQSVRARFNTADTFLLTVGKAGTGSGAVLSNPRGIECGAECSQSYSRGVVVTLSAEAAPGSVFAGWRGACTSKNPVCSVTMSVAQTVTAVFNAKPVVALTVTRSGTGQGRVVSDPAGIDCGSTCSATLDPGTRITLTATPERGSTFAGWTGACTGTTPSCTVTLSQALTVGARFNTAVQRVLTVKKVGTGAGTVRSTQPEGVIDCGTGCTASLDSGQTVTLTATAAEGSMFVRWTGACTGTQPTCTVSMAQARTVTARFNLDNAVVLGEGETAP